MRVKNVAQTYSLEHEGEGVLFDQLFKLLNSNLQNEESYWRELASCARALQTLISQHMSKEEEQHVEMESFRDQYKALYELIKHQEPSRLALQLKLCSLKIYGPEIKICC